MDSVTHTFCTMIRNRSDEHRQAMHCFAMPHSVMSPAFSILRQELDSMIRVIYLLVMKDLIERRRMIESTLRGARWKVQTSNGKYRVVTDREMVGVAQQLQGWTQSVYKFGSAFVHLSDFHNHLSEDPFDKLEESEREDILSHMRYYHGGPCHDKPKMAELALYLPRILEKISSNLECYLRQLELDGTLDE